MSTMANSFLDATSLLRFRQSIADNYLVAHDTQGQINGFIFSVQKATQVESRAEITDYYVEDNTAIQDFIAVKPRKITLTGYVGERVIDKRTYIDQFVEYLTTRLQPITSFSSTLTNYSAQIANYIILAKRESERILDKVDNLYKVALMATKQLDAQQQAFNYFEGIMNNRELVTVVTPYNVYQNMAIETLVAVQGPESLMVSDFSVTFKQINTTNSKFAPSNRSNQGYRADQMSSSMQFGNSVKTVSLESVIGSIL